MSYVTIEALTLISEHLPGQVGAWVCSSPQARRSRERSSRGLRLSANQYKDAGLNAARRGRRPRLRCDINDVQGMLLCRWWLQRCSGASQPAPSATSAAEEAAATALGTVRLRPPPRLSRYMECPLSVCCWGNRHASAAAKNELASTIDVPRLNCSLGELLSLGHIECVEVNGATLAPTPPEWLSCLAVARGVEELTIKAATLPLNELLSFLYSSATTLRVVEVAGIALPRLQMFALAPRIEELLLHNVTVHPHAVVAIGNANGPANGAPPSSRIPLSDLATLPHLRKLDLSNCKGDFDCAGIGQCGFLRSVHLSGCNVKDGDMAYLGQLPRVEELLLSRTRITGVNSLATGKSLRFIQLSNTQLCSEGLVGLETLPCLTRLDLSSTSVSDVNCLGESQSITYLNLAKTRVTSEGITGLAHLPTLEHLMLNDNAVRDVSFLAEARSLRTLSLQSTLVDSNGLHGFGRLQTLQDLTLAHTRVTDVTELKQCFNLWRLDLQGSLVDHAGIVGLEMLPKLRVLLLSQTDVASLEVILHSASLEQLEVKFSRVTKEAAFLGVTKTSALTGVILTHCGVTDVNDLGACAQLRLLNMWSTQVTSEGIVGLGDAASLQEVDLAETCVTDISPLLRCAKIHTLILYKSPLTSIDGVGALQLLRRLDIAETPVTSVRCLATCKNLEVLNISNTAVDDAGFDGIGQAQSLRAVLLSFTTITHLGQLGECSKLEELHAQSCPVTSEGLVGLERATRLVKLNLSYTKIQGGIRRFTCCHKMVKLNVKFTEVPFDEVTDVERDLPTCRVMNDAAQRMAKDVTLTL